MANAVDDDPFRRAMVAMQKDAKERGMLDLAVVYGWSAIRRGQEIIDEQMKLIK
jgi:hypothetical protein